MRKVAVVGIVFAVLAGTSAVVGAAAKKAPNGKKRLFVSENDSEETAAAEQAPLPSVSDLRRAESSRAPESEGGLGIDHSRSPLRAMLDFLQEVNKEGRTIVMVTHDPQAAGTAQRTLRLVNGVIVNGQDAASRGTSFVRRRCSMTSSTHDSETVRAKVREGYGAIARQGASCCGPAKSCCGNGNAQAVATAVGYDEAELAALPDGANMGLSCGNPTAMAELKPGEVVVDLGSGGGFDVFIAARKVRSRRQVDWRRHDGRHDRQGARECRRIPGTVRAG